MGVGGLVGLSSSTSLPLSGAGGGGAHKSGVPFCRVASLLIYCCVRLEDEMDKHDKETYD